MTKPSFEPLPVPQKKEAEPPRISFEKRDLYNTAEARLNLLKPLLAEEAGRLKKLGAPVDGEARIDISAFSKIGQYDTKIIEKDLGEITDKEQMFKHQNTPGAEMARSIGELLEVTKTILFNRYWFNQNFIALRTSKHDDYHFGIDELVFDRFAREPLSEPMAVIDMTTDPRRKDMDEKTARGGKVKYGLRWDKKKKAFKAGSLENLPIFVVQIKNEQVLALAREILDKKLSPESQALEKDILTELRDQCDDYGPSSPNKAVAESYKKAAETFSLMIHNLYI